MVISTEGDLGDAVFLLNILKFIEGAPHHLLLQASDATKAKGPEGVQRLFSAIGPLANAQPYISECRIITPEDKVDWPSGQFRSQHYIRGRTLMEAHLAHLVKTKGIGREINGDEAWLEVTPSQLTEGKVVCNRTGRYRNSLFPWKGIVEHYRHRMVFVGLKHEWREFISHFGYVPWKETANLLEMAQLIAGAELFVGNQSCANALAEGLKKPLIQETSTQFPDCVYVRDGAQHVYDGGCSLPDISGSGTLRLKSNADHLSHFSTSKSPPGGFQYPGIAPSMQFTKIVNMAIDLPEMKGMSRQEVSDKVLLFNVDRCPTWQRPPANSRVMAAIEGSTRQPTSASPASQSPVRVLRPTNEQIRARYRTKVGVPS